MDELREVRADRDDEPITREQLNRAFEILFGMQAREADWHVLRFMGATVGSAIDYIWDHWMAETPQMRKPVRLAVYEALKVEPEVIEFGEDLCRVCGRHVGFGVKFLHIGWCDEHLPEQEEGDDKPA